MRSAVLCLFVAALLCLAAFAAPVSANVNAVSMSATKCALCEFIVSESESILESSAGEAEVAKALDVACSALPAALSLTCKALVSTQLDSIVKAIIARETPDNVCSSLNLCASTAEITSQVVEAELVTVTESVSANTMTVSVTERPVQLEVESVTKVDGALECSFCQLVLTEVDKLIAGNYTEAKIQQALQEVCTVLPSSLKAVCDELIADYTPQLIQLLLQKQPPKVICTEIGLCKSSTTTSVRVIPETVSNTAECSICKFIVGEAESVLGNNATEAQVEQFLDTVCTKAPSWLSGPCQTLVNQYYPQLVAVLVAKLPADQACYKIGLCPKPSAVAATEQLGGFECAACQYIVSLAEQFMESERTEQEIITWTEHVCKLLPAALESVCDQVAEQLLPALIQKMIARESPAALCSQLKICASSKVAIKPVGGFECSVCEMILGYAEAALGNNATEAEIAQFLENVCKVIPTALQSMCDVFIEQYTPQLIQLLLAREDPATICTQIGVCKSVGETPRVGGFECSACEYIMALAENALSANATESEIEQFLQNVCKVVPSAFTSMCDNIIASYFPELVQLLLSREPPATICKQIGLCSGVKAEAKVEVGDFKCAACQYAAQVIEAYIASNRTEQEIASFIEKDLCGLLPGSLKTDCDTIVQVYGPVIVAYLVNGNPPDQLCSKIGICPKASEPASISADTKCTLCEYVVGLADSQIGSNATEAEIAKITANLCKFLPGSLSAECDALIEEFEPLLIQWLLNKEGTPAQFCAKIGLCPKAAAVAAPSWECPACTYAAAILESQLSNEPTEQEIEKLVENVCKFLPAGLVSACDGLISSYGDYLIQYLVKKMGTPTQFCTHIHVCKSASAAVVVEPRAIPERNVDVSLKCAACEFLAKEAEVLIAKNATVTEIEIWLDRACELFPSAISAPCEEIVSEYASFIIDLIVSKEDPQTMCSSIGICPKSRRV